MITVYELLPRIAAQPEGNTWLGVVVDSQEIEQAAEELTDGIEIFAECLVQNIDVINMKAKFLDCIDLKTDYIVLRGFDSWNDVDWQKLDCERSTLDYTKRGGLLVLSQKSVENLARYAPNFSSWIGGRIFKLVLGSELLSDEDCEKRLVTLREWTGLSDEDVIKRAESHQLPSDPEYGEWLILLNRGDLIGC
jgi:hypothetical protein